MRSITKHYVESHELLVEDTALRGSGSSAFPGHALPEGIKESVQLWVKSELNDPKGPEWVTLQGLQTHIKETYDIYMSRNRICKLAKVWGLEWGNIKKTPNGECSRERKLLRQVYVLTIADRVKRGDILVFTDQSYSHLNALLKSFHIRGEPHAQHAPTGSGYRLCWMHALDEGGLLCQYYDSDDDEDDEISRFGGAVVPALGDITSTCATAEMMFAAKEGGDTGDYHGNFNHDIVMSWIKLRLIPSLQARYPEWFKWFKKKKKPAVKPASVKEISVVFDCAPYHIGVHPDASDPDDRRFDPLNTSRPELVQQLMDLGCDELTVSHRFSQRGGRDELILLTVTIDEDEKQRRGQVRFRAALVHVSPSLLNTLIAPIPERQDCEIARVASRCSCLAC